MNPPAQERTPWRRRPIYVAVFLAALTLPQAAAFAKQIQLGFRPLGQAAVRVSFSWDMFATKIERCHLTWTPPLPSPVGPLASQRDLSPLLEWDIGYNSAASYGAFGQWGCRYAQQPTRVAMDCFNVYGQEKRYDFACP